MPKVVLSSTSQAHIFDIARVLAARGQLSKLFSAYPRLKLRRIGFDDHQTASFSGPFLATAGLRKIYYPQRLAQIGEPFHRHLFDRWVSGRVPDCDLFMS